MATVPHWKYEAVFSISHFCLQFSHLPPKQDDHNRKRRSQHRHASRLDCEQALSCRCGPQWIYCVLSLDCEASLDKYWAIVVKADGFVEGAAKM